MLDILYSIFLVVFAFGAAWIGVVTSIDMRDRSRDAEQGKRDNHYQMSMDISLLKIDVKTLNSRVKKLEKDAKK